MKIFDMNTGKETTTTPEEFMNHIAPEIEKWKELQEKLARYEEE